MSPLTRAMHTENMHWL